MNEARSSGARLDRAERRRVFLTSLTWEQEQTVGPRVATAVSAFTCPILKRIVLRPSVRFEYFKPEEVFYFQDISGKVERIEKATRAYEIAEEVGWDAVVRSMKDYDVLPELFFQDPEAYAGHLQAKILGREIEAHR